MIGSSSMGACKSNSQESKEKKTHRAQRRIDLQVSGLAFEPLGKQLHCVPLTRSQGAYSVQNFLFPLQKLRPFVLLEDTVVREEFYML